MSDEKAMALSEPQLPANVEPLPGTQQITPAQARVEAVADTLRSAYAKASTLTLTPEEATALGEDFPDEAFSAGAGGDPNLIYIEHAYLRQRLNKILGVGAAVPIRRREWAEEFSYFKDNKTKKGVRVYVDMVLLVRGCVVGEAIGDAIYYPDNAKTNYSDALESAKSNAFRRVCKEFGVGLQAWMKGWCEGWKARRYDRHEQQTSQRAGQVHTPEPPRKAEPPKPQASAPASADKLKVTFLKRIEDAKMEIAAWGWMRDKAWLLPNEKLADFPATKAPTTKEAYEEAVSEIEAFGAKRHDEHGNLDAELVREFDEVHRIPAEPEDQIPGAEMPPSGKPSVTGVIENVSIKTGTSKRGAWTLYGIAVNQEWHNTFSKSLGTHAESLKGETVDLFYEKTDKGRTALAIRHGGKLVEAGA